MELVISISKLALSFRVDNVLGEGLNELIKLAADKKIKTIKLTGDSRSYTLLRQLALFINLMIDLNNCEIILESNNFKKSGRFISPIYE